MKTLKKLLPLCLVLCLLVGCAPKEPAATVAPAAVADDDSFTFLTSGLASGTTLATVNGEHIITIDDYLFWLALYVDTYRSQGYPLSWDGEGTVEADFKDMILEVTSVYSFLNRHAAELGLTLSEADEARVQAEIDELKSSMGEDYAFWVSTMYRNETSFVETERAMYAGDMLYDYYFGENGTLAPDEAAFAAYAAEAELYGVYNAKHILIRTVDDNRTQLSEEECARAAELANEIYERLRDIGPDEAAFDEEMFAYSEDTGLVAYPGGYEFGPGEMVPEFEYGTLALAPGEMSEIVESMFGYHIIFRLPVEKDSERLREEVLGMKWNEWMDEAQQGIDMQTTDIVWEQLSISAIDEQRTALTDAYFGADAATE